MERSVHSQNGEDGILSHLFSLLGVRTGVFVEIGAADGEQNCTRALAEAGWSGFWIEGDSELVAHARGLGLDERVRVEQLMVTPSTVVAALKGMGVPRRFDLLSLDIDSCDFWVMREVLRELSPTVIVVEINGEHPWPWVLPLRRGTGPSARGWDGSWNYGASLGAYDGLLSGAGYSLVGCDLQGVNAFFVSSASLVDGMHTGPWRSFYRPPSHRPGTLGHPRRSPVAPTVGDAGEVVGGAAELDRVRFAAVEVIGPARRRPGEPVLLLLDVDNGTRSTLASAGDHPHRLTYRIFDIVDGSEVGEREPHRSRLASAVPPGSTRVSGLEVIAPAHSGDYLVVPTLVHEGVGWRDPDPSEGILLTVSDQGSNPAGEGGDPLLADG
ncbi:MAG: hypothetical protein JST64_03095 [Actinobacteria bacterium]|nr:hypothetical protein [Actinomycetota bacterium]